MRREGRWVIPATVALLAVAGVATVLLLLGILLATGLIGR